MTDPDVLAAVEQQRSLDRIKQLKAVKQSAAKASLTTIGDRDQTSGKYQVTNATGIISANGIKVFNSDPDNADIVQANTSGLNLAIDGANAVTRNGNKRANSPRVSGYSRERIRSGAIGDRSQNNGYLNGQTWNFPEIEEIANRGTIIWLDCNWLYFEDEDEVPANNFKFFKKILKFFLGGRKTIYTLPFDDDRLYSQSNSLFNLNNTHVKAYLKKENYKVIEKPLNKINEIKSMFFMPLLNPAEIISTSDFINLRKLAKAYGLMFCAEWSSWTEYDRRALAGLKVRDEIGIVETGFDAGNFRYSDNYRSVNPKIGKIEFSGNANNQFSNLKKSEIFVNAYDLIGEINDPVFALLKEET